MAGIIVKPRAGILAGHDWVYRSEVLKIHGNPAPGDVISLKDSRDRFLGSALFNPHSPVMARRFCRCRQALDEDFLRRRIRQAAEWRAGLGYDGQTRPCRVVWSESDGLPGVILDRYGPHLVLQTPVPGTDRIKALIARVAAEELGALKVWERNDTPGRTMEGLPATRGLLYARRAEAVSETATPEANMEGSPRQEPPELQPLHEFEWGGAWFVANLLTGHKTGFYLDQLDNYARVAAYTLGRHVLDCFSNTGGFAITAAKTGALSVTAVESGAEAVRLMKENAGRNGLEVVTGIVEPSLSASRQTSQHGVAGACPLAIRQQDVFEFLRQAQRGPMRWDLIVLDPPSLAHSARQAGSARRGLRELHLRAAHLLTPRGLLASFCCTHAIGRDEFLRILAEAFWEAGRTVRLVEEFRQPPDHPVLPHLPETLYLHGVMVECLPGR